jgi:hypothetical protein
MVAAAVVVPQRETIDREALVRRHGIRIIHPDPLTPLSVGNGEFAFTADVTGLQTFPEFHDKGTPLATLSQWGWHSFPNPNDHKPADVESQYESHGRKVLYLDGDGTGRDPDQVKSATAWLRSNPHRIDLGHVGFRFRSPVHPTVAIDDLQDVGQTLDLWTGLLSSSFRWAGAEVRVQTLCHPEQDLVAVSVESHLMPAGLVNLRVAFPSALGDWSRAAVWDRPDLHRTEVRQARRRGDFTRTQDETRYHVAALWSDGADLKQAGPHEFDLSCRAGRLELIVAFSERTLGHDLPSFAETHRAASAHWRRFWLQGGAIDLSRSTDPRAPEIERRIVTSQYLTAINCAGSSPPQETGLVCNSWHGKFHLEMHWWHAAHFPLWGREHLLQRSLNWYHRILPAAAATARRQGYSGVRWPKMVGRNGSESPSGIGVFLIWQQPHPIFLAELCRRASPDHGTLEQHQRLVFETAEFMASYAAWDKSKKRHVLGPPLIPAQESYGSIRKRVINPTFELAYWRWGLEIAQQWRGRLGLPRKREWDSVMANLSLPTVRNGAYAAIEVEPYTIPSDHPSMLAAFGMLPPSPLINEQIMRATLRSVMNTWEWKSTWGWDFPMIAMTAARLGETETAIDALLMKAEKNDFLANGHNYQRPNLPLYLPGNGGLLYAVAMMAAGWDGAPPRPTPGFPANGRWNVRWEGLRRSP